MPGEDLHVAGANYTRRAKVWLERTTRVQASWMVGQRFGSNKLTFRWPFGGQQFSFDIGGILRGDEFDGQSFLVESKGYMSPSDQGSHYRAYLAKCYAARQQFEAFTENFMWITWCPFNIGSWRDLCGPEMVKKSVLAERERVLGKADLDEAEALLDEGLVDDVASRLWMIVLSERQEQLVISPRDLSQIEQIRVERGWS
ncbi:MAG TPA: hypothetical protein VFU43_19960 [Streptosporangiaceae bacterium]|nr:hypothetical protein [Streptosporangiaceae bacterium]